MSGGSCGEPVLQLLTSVVQLTVPIGDDGPLMYHFFFACGAFFSVFLLHSSFPLVKLFRSSFVALLSFSDFSVPFWFLFSVLLSARHFLDGAVFRSVGSSVASQVGLNCFLRFCFFVFEHSGKPKSSQQNTGHLRKIMGNQFGKP